MKQFTHVSQFIQVLPSQTSINPTKQPFFTPEVKEPSELFNQKNGRVVFNLLNYLLKQWRWKNHITKPQTYLEKVAGCEERQLRREIRWLESQEILRVKYGHKGEINSYYLTPFWRQTDNFHKLLKFITGIIIFNVNCLYLNPISEPNVRLIYLNDIYIIKNSSTSTTAKMGNAHFARTGDWFFSKRERLIVMNSSLETCEALKQLYDAGFTYTEHGMCKLAAFPARALEYGITQLSTIPESTNDRFAYFIGILNRYCNKLQQFPNWSIYFQLKRGCNIEESNEVYFDMDKWLDFKESRQTPKTTNEDKRSIKGNKRASSVYASVGARVRETDEYVKSIEEKIAGNSTGDITAPVAAENERQKKYQEDLLKMLGLQ